VIQSDSPQRIRPSIYPVDRDVSAPLRRVVAIEGLAPFVIDRDFFDLAMSSRRGPLGFSISQAARFI
jgi:hypothetical protein